MPFKKLIFIYLALYALTFSLYAGAVKTPKGNKINLFSGGGYYKAIGDGDLYYISDIELAAVSAAAKGIKEDTYTLESVYEKGVYYTVTYSEKLTRKNDGKKTFAVSGSGNFYDNGLKALNANKPKEAFQLWSLGAKAKNPDSISKIASAHINGSLGVVINPTKGIELYKEAASLGSYDAMFELFLMNESGTNGVTKDTNKSFEWLSKLAKQNVPRKNSHYESGKVEHLLYKHYSGLYGYKTHKKEITKAIYWLSKAHKKGFVSDDDYLKIAISIHKNEQNNMSKSELIDIYQLLGTAYKTTNIDKAILYYTKGANLGNKNAKYELGALYYYGKLADKDLNRAATLLKESADLDSPQAQALFGLMLKNGEGVLKNYKAAITWFQKALSISNNNITALTNLGLMYKNGQGVKQDYKKAFELFKRLENINDSTGRLYLAEMYENGLGIPKNYNLAVIQYSLSSSKQKNELIARVNKKQKDERDAIRKKKQDELAAIRKKTEASRTKLFGKSLVVADRNELMRAVKAAGATVKKENKQHWGDNYFTADILNGSSELSITYTVDDYFAKAQYTFPSHMGTENIAKVRDFVAKKYGKPNNSKGSISLGEVSFDWVLKDGITLEVSRGWPDTTTYLTYIYPQNYKRMLAEQERQRKDKEDKKYQSQSDAF